MPARGYSSTRKKARPTAKAKPKARPVDLRVAGERSAARAVRARPVAPVNNTKLAREVAAARTKVRRGTGVKSDSGDIRKGAKKATSKEEMRAALAAVATTTSTNRVKPLAVKQSFGKSLKDELEGRGNIAKVVGKAADFVGDNALIVQTGPTTAANVAKSKRGGAIATAMAPNAMKVKDSAPGISRGLKDLVNLPAVAIPSIYQPVAAVVEAAQGDTKRGKKLLKDLPKTDPLAALVTGHPGRALKLAEEHPGFAAVEAFGVKGSLGRGAGRVMRVAPKGSTIHKAASTRRPDKTAPGTELRVKQSYSPDVGRKAAQVLTEKRKAKKAVALHKRADEAEKAGREDAPELRASANKADPFRMSDNEIRKRVDQRVAANETVRRQNRVMASEEAHRAITNTQTLKGSPRARAKTMAANRKTKVKPTVLTTLRAQAIINGKPEDRRAYRDQIAAEHANLGPGAQAANRTLRAEIDKAIKDKPDPVALKRAAERYAEVMAPRQAKLVERGLLGKEQVDKAPLVPYAIRHMDGVKPGKDGPVHADGSPVKAAEIRAHMAERGVKEPAYVTQAPGQRGAKNFFVSSGRPPQMSTGTRTGSATAKGTLDAHPDVLREGAAKAQGLIDAADGFTATVKEFAHKPTLGKLKTKQEADAAARDLAAKTGTQWRAVRIHPFGGREAQIKALLDKATDEGGLGENVGAVQPVREALEAAVRGEDGAGPWALMPEAAAAQQAAHLHNLGVGPKAKALQVVGSGFRRTVLATSPTWMTGNVVEATGRTALARAGPRSYVTGRRVVKRLEQKDPKAAQELAARALSGGHYSMADRQHIRRDSSQFAGGKILEPMADRLGKFWNNPGPKQAAGAWRAWTDLVFRQINGKLESQFQTAMLGKALRDSPLMDEHTFKMSEKAVEQAAQGLRDTNEQAAMAAGVVRMYGQYSAFSPDMRWAIATYTPFIAWTLNAVKFVTDVLPRDHPTATALIVMSENVTEEWRKDKGLDLFIKGALPGWLQGSIPLSGGRHQRAPFRYTPFGAFGDPLDTAAGAVLPQFSSVLAAFKGEDWMGNDLRRADGSKANTLDKAKAAAVGFVDSTVPIVAQAKRVDKKGGKALNPFAPVEPPKKKARKSTSAGGDLDLDDLDLGDLEIEGAGDVDLDDLDLGID